MRRTIAAMLIALGLSVAVVTALADVTFVLNNGQRQSGTLVYKGTGDIGLVTGGQERMFPINDVALIIYNDGDPRPNELAALPENNNPPDLERHTLVLRNGRIIKGKVWHWNPDSVVLDNASGRATYNANDIARLYLAGPDVRRLFPEASQQTGTAGVGGGGRLARGAPQVTVRVEANQPWTDTGIVVRAGERVAFRATGTINVVADVSTGPEGHGAKPGQAAFPVPAMNLGGLIGRVGNGRPFAIGASTTAMPVPASGRLFLGVNDDHHADNSGSFEVQIFRR